MSERMLVIEIPFGAHIMLPERFAGAALNIEFVEYESFPKIIRMAPRQNIGLSVVSRDDIRPCAPEVEPAAQIGHEDIPF